MDLSIEATPILLLLASHVIVYIITPAIFCLSHSHKGKVICNKSYKQADSVTQNYLISVLIMGFPVLVEIVTTGPLQLTEGYSGSDIKLVCKEAVMRSVRKVFHILENLSDEYGVEGVVMDPVTMNDIEETVANTKPSARLLASRYTQWQKEYESI